MHGSVSLTFGMPSPLKGISHIISGVTLHARVTSQAKITD